MQNVSRALVYGLWMALANGSARADSPLCQQADGTPQTPTGIGTEPYAVASDYVAHHNYAAYENVDVLEGLVITQLAWRGVYGSLQPNQNCAPIDNFEVKIAPFACAEFAPPFTLTPPFAAYSNIVGVSRETTGEQVEFRGEMRDVYEYTWSLPTPFVAPATSKIGISIVNFSQQDPSECLWAWLRAPGGDGFATATCPMGLFPGTPAGSDLDLCINPELLADRFTISLSAGGSQVLTLATEQNKAGWIYWMFGSAAGTSPGMNFGAGVILPLNSDPLFWFTVNKPFASIFGGFLSVLDVNGEGSATLTLPPGLPPTLAGVTIHHAYLATPTFPGADFASHPESVLLVP